MIELKYPLQRTAVEKDLLHYVYYRLSHPIYRILTILVVLGTVFSLPYYYYTWDLDSYWILLHLTVFFGILWRYKIARYLMRKAISRSQWVNADVVVKIDEQNISYKIEHAGSAWHQLPLNHLTTVLEFPHAWILNASKKGFIWLPFHAFSNQHTFDTVKRMLIEHEVPFIPTKNQ